MYLGEFNGGCFVPAANKKEAAFSAAFYKAIQAGLAAGKGTKTSTMVLVGGVPGEPPKTYVDHGGPCGFAWVNVAPGNSPFANWLKKNKFARKSYYGGVDIWISDFGQSVEQKEACASAMAKVLQMELGMSSISAMSRLD